MKKIYLSLIIFLFASSAFPQGALAPVGVQQFFNSNGQPASGLCVYTYATGTTTKIDTYTDADLGAGHKHTNPIVLDSAGRPTSGPVYLSATSYKFVYGNKSAGTCPATPSAIWTVDPVMDFGQIFKIDLASTSAGKGDAYVGYKASGTGATARTVHDRLIDLPISILDYMTTAQIADVRAGTGSLDVTTAIQAALDAGINVTCPSGKYLVTAPLTLKPHQHFYGAAATASYNGPTATGGCQILANHLGNSILDFTGLASSAPANGIVVENITLIGGTPAPKSAIYMSRNSGCVYNGTSCMGEGSAGQHTVRNVTVVGNFSEAGLYIVSSEVNRFDNLTVDIRGGGGKYGVYASGANDLGFTPSLTAGGSTEANWFTGLSVSNYDPAGLSLIKLVSYSGDVYGWAFRDLNLAPKYGDYVSIQTISGDIIGPISFDNVVGEILAGGSGSANAFIFSQYPAGSGYTIHGFSLHNATMAVGSWTSGGGITAQQYFLDSSGVILDEANIQVASPHVTQQWASPAARNNLGIITNSSITIGGRTSFQNGITTQNSSVVGAEMFTDSALTTPGDWTGIPAGCTVAAGAATCSGASGALFEDNLVTSGAQYRLKYTISSYSAGGNMQTVVGDNLGFINSGNASQTEFITPTTTSHSWVQFYMNNFTGVISNISLKTVIGGVVSSPTMRLRQMKYADLASLTPQNGDLVYCQDCRNFADDAAVFDSTAADSGNGTLLCYENGAWRVH